MPRCDYCDAASAGVEMSPPRKGARIPSVNQANDPGPMSKPSRESEHRATQRALFSDYSPPLLREARQRQDEIMARRFAGKALRIADLGCGDAYHASMLAPGYTLYHGFELAPAMAAMARARIEREGLDKATLFEGDVAQMPLPETSYDLVICMYFTPGNFRDVADDLSLYTDEYLDHNPVFTRIMRRFFDLLSEDGAMFLTVYKDNAEAEAAQHDLYRNSSQHVVTPPGSRFVATREGFWSARWTRRSMRSNLADAGIDEDVVTFHDLNEIAWLVEIVK